MGNRHTIHATQLIAWLQKLEKNIENIDLYDATPKEELIGYLRYQHKLFDIINQALEGKVFFVGTAQDIRYMEEEDGQKQNTKSE